MPAEEISLALELNCQSCHSLDYVLQQRLTAAQWVATLTKMRSWGAALDEAQVGPLADALAVSHGAASALRDFPVADVPPFRVEPLSGRGDVAHGKALFEGRCLVCHGPDARGGIGVNLADRPLLQHPAAFSSFVKRGRGRMPPHPDLDATQYDDLIAWLRTK